MYLVYGDDRYLISQRTKQIVNELNKKAECEVDEFSYLDFSLNELLNAFNTLPMFSEKKIVVVHDCLFLTEEKVKLKFDNNIDHLLKYLSDPNPSVEVIFICSTSKISNRLKITKKCKSFEHVYEIAPLSASQLNSAIKERISNAGGKIDQSGIEALVQYVPNNLDVIFNEVDKLLNLQTPIDRKMVEANVVKYLDTDLFKLVNCLLENDIAGFLNVYYYLKNLKLDYYAFIGLLTSNIVAIRNIAILSRQQAGIDGISATLGLHPYRAKMLFAYAKKKTLKELNNMLISLYKFDKMIKQGAFDMNVDVIMDIFMLKLFNK